MTMKPFDRDSSCVKCGNMSAGVFFRSARQHGDWPYRPARILRTCIRCRHQWFETPLDEVPAAEPRLGGDPQLEGSGETVMMDKRK
jgi:hypothetical protein